jgi:hypothetical protein
VLTLEAQCIQAERAERLQMSRVVRVGAERAKERDAKSEAEGVHANI